MKARVAVLASVFSLWMVAVVAAQVSTTTGTVVSNTGASLVVTTDSGQQTFIVDAQTSLPADLTPGTRVTVEYHTLANDKLHAFKVSPLAATDTTTPTEPAPTETMKEAGTPTTGAANTTTTGTTMDETATTGRRLPATASPLPLLALAGSLAVAGGALLRRRRA